jgi:hypothetical protein
MNRHRLLIVTGGFAAAVAHAQPRAEDGVVDPWAPVSQPPAAAWSPAPIALIVDPWTDPTTRRVAARASRSSNDPLDQIVDPWKSSQAQHAREQRRTDLRVVEIVDPWADRPKVARAAFPADGVIDPWQGRAINGPARQ